MAATTSDKAVQKILKSLSKRSESLPTDRWGIGTAGMYLRKLLTPGFVKPAGWDDMVKAADSRLTYCHPNMLVEKSADGQKIALTEGSILDFNAIVTTKSMDRDGDVMEPMGADLDPHCPLLFNHMPDQPIGRLVKELSKTDDQLRAQFAIAETALGKDVATLIEFGALRISHGFLPLKFAPRHSKDINGVDWEGWRITKFLVLETSAVAVPSNSEATITAFSRNKLFTPMVKSWAKSLFDARPVIVPGIEIPVAETPELKAVKPTVDDFCAALVGKKKKPAKPVDDDDDDEDDEPEQYGEDDDGVGISEKAVAKCAMGIKGCEHFGQAFVNHAQKSVHHTMCPKCTVPLAKAKKPNAKEDAEPAPEPYHTAGEIQDLYSKVPGVQHVTVAKGYHPPLCKSAGAGASAAGCWQQVHPISQAWVQGVQAGGPGNLQNQQQQNNGQQPPPKQGGDNQQADDNDKGFDPMAAPTTKRWSRGDKSFATPGKKWLGCCGMACLEGSWEDIRGDLQPSLYDYLREHGVDLPDQHDADVVKEQSQGLPWVSIGAMFDDHAIVEVYMPFKPDHAEDQPAYSLSWKRSDDDEPVWDGDPTPVKINTTVTVMAEEMNKAAKALQTKEKKAKCDHLNDDGTFKEVDGSAFDGCVAHMTSKCGGSHSEESAKKICGTIAANVGKNHRATIRDVDQLASFKTIWSHDGIEAIGGKLKSAPKDPCEIQHIDFDSQLWTAEEAQSWLKANGYEVKTWTDAAREAARAALEMIHGGGGKEADEKSGKAYEAGVAAREATAKADKSGTAEDHEEAARRNVDASLAHSVAFSAHNEQGHNEQAKEHDSLSEQYGDLALEHKISAGKIRESSGGGKSGGRASVATDPKNSPRKPVAPDKLAQQLQKDDKSGRVLSGNNMQRVQDAMDCHQEILKLGPEHASKTCKALVKEAHGHLNDVITQAGPPATEPTIKEMKIGDVNAWLASASAADVEEAHTMIQARKRRNGAGGQHQLLSRLLGR